MKQTKGKGFFAGLNFNKFTYIAAAAALVLAIVLAVIESSVADCPARNWFWMLAGVFCLGEGIVLYVHGITAKASNVCILAGVVLTALGVLWFVTDICVNGGSSNVVGSGWWVGLIACVVVGLACYFIPVLVKKNNK